MRNPTPPGQPPPWTAELGFPAPRVVRDVFALVSAGPDSSILEPGPASSSSPGGRCPRSGGKGVPSQLPSCIHFPRELLNVTLEGAAAPQASSSPPPSAVVGCKSHAWRQHLCSLGGPALGLPKQTSRQAPYALGAPRPDPAPPPPHLCILNLICAFHQTVRFTDCADPDPWHPSSHATSIAPPAPLPHSCLLPPSMHTPLLYVMRAWQVFFFFLLFKRIHIVVLQNSFWKLRGHCVGKAS